MQRNQVVAVELMDFVSAVDPVSKHSSLARSGSLRSTDALDSKKTKETAAAHRYGLQQLSTRSH